jgi:hypothetical protein
MRARTTFVVLLALTAAVAFAQQATQVATPFAAAQPAFHTAPELPTPDARDRIAVWRPGVVLVPGQVRPCR